MEKFPRGRASDGSRRDAFHSESRGEPVGPKETVLAPPLAPPPGPLPANPGVSFRPAWLKRLSLPPAWLETALAELASPTPEGGPPPEDAAASDLLDLLQVLDLTSLSGDDTVTRVRALARRARNPLPMPLRKALGIPAGTACPAAVCVFPAFLEEVRQVLQGSTIRLATVAGGFPHGLSPLEVRVQEVRSCLSLGAQEIDVVIRREWALRGKWERLYDEIRALREGAGEATLKVILATGELGDPQRMARTALVAMMAGADFVKTSTGKEATNATLPAGLALAHAIRAYFESTGFPVGLKPAGGIRTVSEAFRWLRLAARHLGGPWTRPALFRIGASALLDDLLLRLRQGSRGEGDTV